VRKRSTVVAWSMLVIDVASVSVGYLLMVTNGIFQTTRPASLACC
jgi:hypothetical protein